jgi:thioredoxin 2
VKHSNAFSPRQTPVLETVCGRCFTLNRLPLPRLNESSKCGKCSESLFDGTPVTVDDSTFDRLVGREALPVVVDFWAAWCAPCRAMAPVFLEAAQELRHAARFAKVDVDASPLAARRFAIMSIPTLVVFRGAQEVARQSGVMRAPQLISWILAMA